MKPHTRIAEIPDPLGLLPVLALFILLASAMLPARADDKADMDRTKIIGNRELPKVLYIVPWKKPVPGELPGRPLTSVLDETMEPLDRDVFRRQVRYGAQVAPPEAKPAPEKK